MRRMGHVVGLNPAHAAEYRRLHAAVLPEVLTMIGACNIRNYTIFLREPENMLFAYWEYYGTDFAADAARMASDPATRRWWELCGPCQAPLETRGPDDWWAGMDEVFHLY